MKVYFLLPIFKYDSLSSLCKSVIPSLTFKEFFIISPCSIEYSDEKNYGSFNAWIKIYVVDTFI